MKSYRKLVRDRIPEILTQKGLPHQVSVADEVEYRAELIKKLGEEVQEFSDNPSPEELADVLEVANALISLPEFSSTDSLRKEKNLEKGSFEKRYIVSGEKP